MKPRLHNLISYGGALLVFLLVVILRLDTSAPRKQLYAAGIGILMWCGHFIRRASESAFIHRYGKPRVPLADVITEYVYYWGFAVWNALSLLSLSYVEPKVGWLLIGSVVFWLAENGNAKAHRMLRDLRPAGSTERVIPRGFLFERISSPHYLFEILSWVGFALATQTWASLAFLLLGAGILANWAHTRHQAYRKDFDGLEGRPGYPASRRALIPGVF